jgi:HK97 family phage major capsid protein
VSTTLRRPLHRAPTRLERLEATRLDRWISGEPDHFLISVACWFAELVGNAPLQVALMNKGADIYPRQRAAGIGVDSMGGDLVPEPIVSEIIALRQAAGVMRRNATTWTIRGSDVMNVPRRTSAMQTAFIVENSGFTSTDLTFDSVGLSPRKLGCFCKLSTEVNEDSAADWASYLVAEFSNALALTEDDCGIGTADGSSTYGGMRSITSILVDGNHGAGLVPAASGHKTSLTLDAADLALLMSSLPEQYWTANTKFFCSAYTFANTMARLSGVSGANIETGVGLTYLGIPCVVSPKMVGSGDQSGKILVLLGDMSRCVALGSSRELVVKRSDQRYFELDQTAFMASERVHLVAHSLGDASVAGPIVGLQGTA